eukprot:TRINITY_DN120100_c0_g1_i1.p1 TRINITY_DN120100_c0_g1~~TRINITY_DN120100_c0_g1_i1.p1  ORF type:complete len:513 (-),score=52.64 TRINITY_DN120100_c0_g1_i1:47-1585(-)
MHIQCQCESKFCRVHIIYIIQLSNISKMKPYNSLADFASNPSEKITSPVYGVVIDATRVYYRPQNSKYASMVKIVDSSWSQIGHPKDYAPFVKVLFMSKSKAEVPHVKQIGTIIKFAGGLVRLIEETKHKILMFSCDGVSVSGKWVMANENEGLVCGPAHGALMPNEINNMKGLQKFAKAYLEEHFFVELTQNLAAARALNKEFDVVGRVVKINPPNKSLKNFTVFKILDHTDKAYLLIPEPANKEFSNIQVKDFVFLKGVYYSDLVTHKIELQDPGNALIIPEYSVLLRDYQRMMNMFIEGMDLDSAIDEKRFSQPIEASVVQNTFLPFTPLKEATGFKGLFGKKYRVKVYILDMGPKDLKNWVKGYCPNCYRFFYLTGEDEETKVRCRVCKKEAKMVYQVQLFVKDKELRDTPAVCRLLLYTHNGKGVEFFDNEPPVNCHRSERLYKKLQGIYKLLIHYNVYLDCAVERMSRDTNAFLQISDTVVKYKPNQIEQMGMVIFIMIVDNQLIL